jgi:hypothetical protein
LFIETRHINTMTSRIGVGANEQGSLLLSKAGECSKKGEDEKDEGWKMAHGKQYRKPVFFAKLTDAAGICFPLLFFILVVNDF